MSRKAPIAVATTGLADHPAARAWSHLDGGPPATVELWRDTTRTKPAVFRLTFADPERPAVFAKRCPRSSLELERRVYAEVLPHLPLTTPRCFGYHLDSDGSGWLFTEDVGGRRLAARDPEERVLAARWLGTLHRSAADLPAAARLPDAGPPRYLAHLRFGREQIRDRSGNPGLTADDHVVLDTILDQYDALEARWDDIERACRDLPVTLVHGDFRPRNVRIRAAGGAAIVCPIDWEMAGWGVPAADLASARRMGLSMLVDAAVYEEVVRERWPLEATGVRRLSILGDVFWALAGIGWETAGLVFDSPRYLLKPISSMRSLSSRLSSALEAGREWLR